MLPSDFPMGWDKADLHLHTSYSDGMMSPAETVVTIAQETDLRVIAITDHDTAKGALLARSFARRKGLRLEVVVGQEITTDQGDVLALYIEESLPRFSTAAEAIDAVHRLGGLAIAPHPFFVWGWEMESVHLRIRTLPFDAIESRHGCPLSVVSNGMAHLVNRWFGQKLPEMGNSDAHTPYAAGQAFTWYQGHTAAQLRTAIQEGAIFPGGSLWTPRTIWRMAKAVRRHGWPGYPSAQNYLPDETAKGI